MSDVFFFSVFQNDRGSRGLSFSAALRPVADRRPSGTRSAVRASEPHLPTRETRYVDSAGNLHGTFAQPAARFVGSGKAVLRAVSQAALGRGVSRSRIRPRRYPWVVTAQYSSP